MAKKKYKHHKILLCVLYKGNNWPAGDSQEDGVGNLPWDGVPPPKRKKLVDSNLIRTKKKHSP